MKDRTFRAKAKITGFFTTAIKSAKSNSKNAKLLEPTNADEQSQASIQEPPTIIVEEKPHSIVDSSKSKRTKPAQERLYSEIAVLNKESRILRINK